MAPGFTGRCEEAPADCLQLPGASRRGLPAEVTLLSPSTANEGRARLCPARARGRWTRSGPGPVKEVARGGGVSAGERGGGVQRGGASTSRRIIVVPGGRVARGAIAASVPKNEPREGGATSCHTGLFCRSAGSPPGRAASSSPRDRARTVLCRSSAVNLAGHEVGPLPYSRLPVSGQQAAGQRRPSRFPPPTLAAPLSEAQEGYGRATEPCRIGALDASGVVARTGRSLLPE
jgi:hypothetical protein